MIDYLMILANTAVGVCFGVVIGDWLFAGDKPRLAVRIGAVGWMGYIVCGIYQILAASTSL